MLVGVRSEFFMVFRGLACGFGFVDVGVVTLVFFFRAGVLSGFFVSFVFIYEVVCL